MSVELTSTYAPSGAFCPMPQTSTAESFAPSVPVSSNYLIYNPGVVKQYRNSYTIEQINTKAEMLLTECRTIPIIDQSDIDQYGQICVHLAERLATANSHLRLGPLRGAARPCLLMNVMASGSGNFTFFDYQAGCQTYNAERVKSDLYSILSNADPNEGIYKIQVLDTAIGGQGINALTCYLRDLKEKNAQFRKQRWELDLLIIHPHDANIGNIERVKSYSTSKVFDVRLQRFEVPDLITEDYEGALGLDITHDHEKFLVKPSYHRGQFLLKSNDGARLVRSDALVNTFDELFSKSITDVMITSQNIEQVGVVWSDYEQKG